MNIPVAIIRWIAAKVLLICTLIVLVVIIAVPAALCLMRAFFEPVPTSTEPVTGVKVRIMRQAAREIAAGSADDGPCWQQSARST
jgi:hypothetical protein